MTGMNQQIFSLYKLNCFKSLVKLPIISDFPQSLFKTHFFQAK